MLRHNVSLHPFRWSGKKFPAAALAPAESGASFCSSTRTLEVIMLLGGDLSKQFARSGDVCGLPGYCYVGCNAIPIGPGC